MKISATGELSGRAVLEWIGKDANSKIPDRVRLRLHLRYSGRDAITGAKLRKGWHCDHVTALRDWVPTPEAPHGNRESNLQPVNAKVNTDKAAKENTARAKITSIQKKHRDIVAPKAKIQSAPFKSRLKSDDKFARIAAGHKAHMDKMQVKGGI